MQVLRIIEIVQEKDYSYDMKPPGSTLQVEKSQLILWKQSRNPGTNGKATRLDAMNKLAGDTPAANE